MSSAPLVSILLPTYNAYPFILERIDGIRTQTYRNFRVIIFDSGSSDGTQEVIKSATKDPRFEVISGPREGLYKAWNFLKKKATGSYCYIATADDSFHPDFLQVAVEDLETNPSADMWASPIELVDESGLRLHRLESTHPGLRFMAKNATTGIRDGTLDALLHIPLDMLYVSLTAFFFRTANFTKALDFPTNGHTTADREWTMRYLPGKRIFFRNRILANWRLHTKQASATINAEAEADYRRVYDEQIWNAAATTPRFSALKHISYQNLSSHCSFLLRRDYARRPTVTGTVAQLLFGCYLKHPFWSIQADLQRLIGSRSSTLGQRLRIAAAIAKNAPVVQQY